VQNCFCGVEICKCQVPPTTFLASCGHQSQANIISHLPKPHLRLAIQPDEILQHNSECIHDAVNGCKDGKELESISVTPYSKKHQRPSMCCDLSDVIDNVNEPSHPRFRSSDLSVLGSGQLNRRPYASKQHDHAAKKRISSVLLGAIG
jgi:hypothetical protein